MATERKGVGGVNEVVGCVCLRVGEEKCVCVMFVRVGGGVTGENPLWAEASVGLHLTQHCETEKSRKFPSSCLI